MSFPGNARLQPGSYYHSRGYLPHLDIPEAMQHVTYHLADSLPAEALERMEGWRPGWSLAIPECMQVWHQEYWDRFIRSTDHFQTLVLLYGT